MNELRNLRQELAVWGVMCAILGYWTMTLFHAGDWSFIIPALWIAIPLGFLFEKD